MTAFTAGVLSLNEKKVIIEERQSFLKCGGFKKNTKQNKKTELTIAHLMGFTSITNPKESEGVHV